MADTENTPPSVPTRALPEPPALPDQADLHPAGTTRRWAWLLGGLTAGAGSTALVLSLIANLATTTAAPSTPTTAPTGPATPITTPGPALVDGCALLRPETVERYIKGATCLSPKPIGSLPTSNGTWTSNGSGYTEAMVGIMLSPFAESIYQQTLTDSRTTATTTNAKITADRTVPGLGDKATLLYISDSGHGYVELTVLQHNAVVTTRFSAITRTGLTFTDMPPETAEAAAIACAKDALDTLT